MFRHYEDLELKRIWRLRKLALLGKLAINIAGTFLFWRLISGTYTSYKLALLSVALLDLTFGPEIAKYCWPGCDSGTSCLHDEYPNNCASGSLIVETNTYQIKQKR